MTLQIRERVRFDFVLFCGNFGVCWFAVGKRKDMFPRHSLSSTKLATPCRPVYGLHFAHVLLLAYFI